MTDFVFVEHNDSPEDKRIRDVNARKAIRGQAMRKVRENEKLLGKKRLSGRRKKIAKTAKDEAGEPSTNGTESMSTPGLGSRAFPPKNGSELMPTIDFAHTAPYRDDRAEREKRWKLLEPEIPTMSCEDLAQLLASESNLRRPKEYVLEAIVRDEMSRVGRIVFRKRHYSSNVEAHHIANGHLQQPGAVAGSAIPPDIKGLYPAESTARHQLADRQWIEELIFYCLAEFLPSCIPIEHKYPPAQIAGKLVIAKAFMLTRTAFLGHLASASAHRAVRHGHRRDTQNSPKMGGKLEGTSDNFFHHMKALTIEALRQRYDEGGGKAGEIDQETIEARCTLVSAGSLVGDFDDALRHLQQIENLADTAGVPTTKNISRPELSMWVLWADVKLAEGLGTRPRFNVVAGNRAISKAPVLVPEASSDFLAMFSTLGFSKCQQLSEVLIGHLGKVGELLAFWHVREQEPRMLTDVEYGCYLTKCLVTEHDLITYAYNTFPPAGPDLEDDLQMEPIEQAVRFSAMCLMNLIGVVSKPAHGVGRALTRRLWQTYRTHLSGQYYDGLGPLHSWICFTGAQSAERQPEEEHFIRELANLIPQQGWTGSSWESVVLAMSEFLYFPHLQESSWKRIWECAVKYPKQEF